MHIDQDYPQRPMYLCNPRPAVIHKRIHRRFPHLVRRVQCSGKQQPPPTRLCVAPVFSHCTRTMPSRRPLTVSRETVRERWPAGTRTVSRETVARQVRRPSAATRVHSRQGSVAHRKVRNADCTTKEAHRISSVGILGLIRGHSAGIKTVASFVEQAPIPITRVLPLRDILCGPGHEFKQVTRRSRGEHRKHGVALVHDRAPIEASR